MLVNKIKLKNYRNFENLEINLSEGINIFYGQNAQGKTNFLESIYLCSKGRSHRTHIDKELIFFNKEEAMVQAIVQNNSLKEKIDINLKKNKTKGIAVNGIALKKIGELYGILLTVIFSPEDLNLIKLGPAERRRFMDIEICQLSNIYYYELSSYYKILKQRNSFLKSFKNNYDSAMLSVWDEQLVYHGCKIIKFRTEFIVKINDISNQIHKDITQNKENLKIIYKPNVTENDFYDKLLKNIERDLILKTTSVGIHKDDVDFYINDINVKNYASQGQQRTVALSTKLAEIEIIKQNKNNIPVLLLDDVLSELDVSRQKYLLSHIKNVQTIITCTGVEDIINKNSGNCNIYEVNDGEINFKKDFFMI